MMAAVAAAAMTLGELFGPVAGDLQGVEVSDLVLDSRRVTPGVAFVAMPGSTHHGLEFAEDALARGAAAVVYEPADEQQRVDGPALAVEDLTTELGNYARTFYGRGMEQSRLAGVTGTNGKTTVAYLIAQAQTLRGIPCGYLGTLGAGIPPGISGQDLTTPDCLTLHKTIRELETTFAAMEVSSHALSQNRVAGLNFDTAAFTNLTHDHLDYHGDLDSYRVAKSLLFALPELEHAILNVDDPASAVLADNLHGGVKRLNVSMKTDTDVRGRIVRNDLAGIVVEVRVLDAESVIESTLIGDFNAENLLVALGVLIAWDVPLAEACDALSRCGGVPGRMQLYGGNDSPWVVVDYAHTPDALARALGTLREIGRGDIWCVFGCGGQRDVEKRPAMGSAAAAFADHIVLTDDNPREEDPGAIVADIRAGLVGHPDVWVEHDRRRAIVETIGHASPGDVVLIAGKGHEESQLIGGQVRALSDQAVVADALGGLT